MTGNATPRPRGQRGSKQVEFITFWEMWDYWNARRKHGALHEFCIYRPTVTNGASVEMMLRRYHVGIYGRKEGTSEHWEGGPPDLLGFSVRLAQARWAERLLIQYGAAVLSELVDPGHAQLQDGRGTMPRQWTGGMRAETITGHFVDAMARVFGVSDRERHTAPTWAEGEG